MLVAVIVVVVLLQWQVSATHDMLVDRSFLLIKQCCMVGNSQLGGMTKQLSTTVEEVVAVAVVAQ